MWNFTNNLLCIFFAYKISTHYAGYQGAIAARNILLPLTDPGLYKNVPACTFTEPEVNDCEVCLDSDS